MKKIRIFSITIFVIISILVAIYFQWAEFYKGYSYDNFNFLCSIIFLFEWILVSFYFGIIKEDRYLKFIIIYWTIGIVISLIAYLLQINQSVMKVMLPLYAWYGAPLYGFRYAIFILCNTSIEVPLLMLITIPVGMFFSLIGYFTGRLKKIN